MPTVDQQAAPTTRQNARGEATRELILITAERLFAERGIAAVPLRDIGIAAGQKNNVAVQYHFGDRETLVREVVRFRASFVQTFLDELVSGRRPLVMVEHIQMFVKSLTLNLEDDNHYIEFLSRYLIERGGYGGLEEAVSADTIAGLRELVYRTLSDLPVPVIEERWEVMMTTAVHTLDDLVRFLTAGIEAPIH
jgi:AcrR family transcriptional regulator